LQRLNRDDRSRKQIEMLDALGFDWDPFRTKWDKAFAFLEIYREHKGHCLVPADYKTPDGYYLGKWVRVQRRAKLSDERKPDLMRWGLIGSRSKPRTIQRGLI
jgi:hypothetical protein